MIGSPPDMLQHTTQTGTILWSGLAGLTLENVSASPVRLAGGGLFTLRHPVQYHFEIERRPSLAPVPARVDTCAIAHWRLRGHFEASVERQGGSLFLHVAERDAVGSIDVEAPHSGCPDEALAAILGIHAFDSPEAAGLAAESWLSPTPAQAGTVARLRKACLDRVSLACLQPDFRNGNQWLDTSGGRILRGRLSALAPEAIAARLRRSGTVAAIHVPATHAGIETILQTLGGSVEGACRTIAIPVRLPEAEPRNIQVVAACDGSITGYEEAGILPAAHAAAEHAMDLASRGLDRTIGIEAATQMPSSIARRFLGRDLIPATGAPEESVEIRICYQLKTSQIKAWSGLPPERSGAYFPAAAALSAKTQEALRKWVGRFLAADLERMRDLKEGPSYLLYQASVPFRPKTRAAFSYDILDPEHVRILYRQASAAVKAFLPAVEADLTTAGWKPIARSYSPRKIAALLESTSGELPRPLASLVAAEATMIENLVRIATESSTAARLGRKFAAKGGELTRAIQLGLRRAAKGPAVEWLAPVIFAEATLGLAAALGADPECEVVVQIRTAGGGTIHTLHRRAD